MDATRVTWLGSVTWWMSSLLSGSVSVFVIQKKKNLTSAFFFFCLIQKAYVRENVKDYSFFFFFWVHKKKKKRIFFFETHYYCFYLAKVFTFNIKQT